MKLILILTILVKTLSSYLKIDIVEGINLHCLENNEFYCNPYAVIQFKYSNDNKTTRRVGCTKNPKWESSFTFQPEICSETITIKLYQYLTFKDKSFLGNDIYQNDKATPGYLGKIELELEKLPLGTIDDWFMVQTPVDNSRIMFPSCIHLRITYANDNCTNGITRPYNSNNEFQVFNYIPMCKKDYAYIYRTKFSQIYSSETIQGTGSSLEEGDNDKDSCKMDSNADYGFLHKFSNLTSIEEALVYRIIKRTTGENINYENFSNEYSENNKKVSYIKSYKEFFDQECFKRPDLTIERVNEILKHDVEEINNNVTHPYINKSQEQADPIMLSKNRMESVYHDTFEHFYALEELKNLDKMDDDAYINSLNKLVDVIKDLNLQNKTDATMFMNKNKVTLSKDGSIDPREESFFKVYALYKWNGGHLSYDELKREYLLRRKYFYCYETVSMIPTNIVFRFIDDKCPDNYVCIDPNGIIIDSLGRDPKKVFPSLLLRNNTNVLNEQLSDLDKLIALEKNMMVINETTSLKTAVNHSDDYYNKFDVLYFQRLAKIKKKKEIIINKVFNCISLLGETLAIASYNNNTNQDFLDRESSLIKKYLILYNTDLALIDKSTQLFLNLILCNSARTILADMLEGLCVGDDRSIKIFMEIVRTVLIDSLLNKAELNSDDLNAKVILLRTLNKQFCFKTLTKIKFVENMLMLDVVKEKLIAIIWNNDSNLNIENKIKLSEDSIPNNNRSFHTSVFRFKSVSNDELVDDILESNNIKTEESAPKNLNNNLQEGNKINFNNDLTGEFKNFKDFEKGSSNIGNPQFKQFDNDFVTRSINQYNNPGVYQTYENAPIYTFNNKPNDKEVMDKIMTDPATKEVLERNNAKVIIPQPIETTYQVEKKVAKQVTVNENSNLKLTNLDPTKKLILNNLMNEDTFNDLMSQNENKPDEQGGLFTVLKNIQNRKCSSEYLCLEIGSIYGPFDKIKPKNVTIMTTERENMHVIIKPVIIVNDTMARLPPPRIKPVFEDCEEGIRFKEKEDGPVKRKFYRKVEFSNDVLGEEIFKQGINLVIIKREKNYPKVFERTFNTNDDQNESDSLANMLQESGYDKIIIITGIGKWMGSVTPKLIKEIKQIGGPDLSSLASKDTLDNSSMDHSFILIGRRGLCRYNGVFRIKNYDIGRDMKKYFPDLSSDPNDCLFDKVEFDNMKNSQGHKADEFYHNVDLRLTLNLNNDNRFSYSAPTITNVDPYQGDMRGGQVIHINGFNLGDVKEITVMGVCCRDIKVYDSKMISCVTGENSIIGAGVGNIMIKLNNGLTSPKNTCNMYQYMETRQNTFLPEQQQINSMDMSAGLLGPMLNNMPVVPRRIYLPSNLMPVPFNPNQQPVFNSNQYSFKEKEQTNTDIDNSSTTDSTASFAQQLPLFRKKRRFSNLKFT
jgi:hypothetical protein